MEVLSETPYLKQYLEARKNKNPYIGAWIVTALASVVFTWLPLMVGLATKQAFYLGFVFAGMFATAGVYSLMVKPRDKRKRNEFERYKALEKLFSLDNRKLVRRLDPIAAQMLEEGAMYWRMIGDVLGSSLWAPEVLSAYFKDFRNEAQVSADRTMEDLVVLLSDCMGDPLVTPGDEVKGMLSDVFELKLNSAANRFVALSKGDPARFNHHSPRIIALEPVAQSMVTKLRELYGAVSSLQAEEIMVQKERGMSDIGVQRIEALLQNLSSVRVASEELDQETQEFRKG